MSFGYSLSDAVLLTQLAWNTVQNARKACGEYDELTQQVSALHVVLRRFQKEGSVDRGEGQSKSLNREHQDTYNDEIQVIVSGCEKVLGTLDKILKKYNTLSERERGRRSKMLWKKVRFGNGEMADLEELRGKVVYHTSLLTLLLNLRSTGSIGRVEQQMNDAGGHLKDIKGIVNGIAAVQLSQTHQEGSILSAYTNDDRSAWKDIRRDLRHKHGFQDADLRKHQAVIVEYITELGNRGILDERDLNEDKEENEDEECDNRAAVQANLAADEHSKALRDTDNAHLKPDFNVSSKFTSEDDPCNEDQILVGPGNESLVESLSALQKKFDEDYVPLCLEFLNAPPKDEETSVERHRLLSDGILTDILLKLAPINPESNDSSDSPDAQINKFLNQVQRWLAKLDEAAKENITEWLVQLGDRLYKGLIVQFINASVRQDLSEMHRKEAYAKLEKKISQDLILLDDIEVDGSPGLGTIKAHLKGDLKAMQEAITMVNEKRGWQLDEQVSLFPALIPRVVLKIKKDQRVIVSRQVASIDLLRPKPLGLSQILRSTRDACISCRRNDELRKYCFPCGHKWCDSCIRALLELSMTWPKFRPPNCCTRDPINLYSVATLFDATFKQKWSNRYAELTKGPPRRCAVNTCGNLIDPWDYRWTIYPTHYRPYTQCSRCKNIHMPLLMI